MLLADVLSSAGIQLNQRAIDKLEEIITEQSSALGRSNYGNLKLADTAFGGFDRSGSLDWHHDRAHKVVYDTVVALMDACVTYAQGVEQARTEQARTDEETADTLKRQADRVVAADGAAYDRARNEQLTTPEPSPPATTSEGSDQ